MSSSTASPAPETPPAESQKRAAKAPVTLFGEIISVMMSSPGYKHYSLADLEWLVMPAIFNNQFIIAEASAKEGAPPAPVALALWAKVSEEVDAKLSENLERPWRLRPDEWNSGDIVWLLDAIGPSKIINAIVEQLRTTRLAGQSVKLRGRDEKGTLTVATLPPAQPGQTGGDGAASETPQKTAPPLGDDPLM
ncbi:MAG TPA: toxin-activating lysine-acyltransferase [Rhodobacteraceae bacterium]|nr:toxin-activating lysine-acyltransferase [Paracoccaceae bacterium]